MSFWEITLNKSKAVLLLLFIFLSRHSYCEQTNFEVLLTTSANTQDKDHVKNIFRFNMLINYQISNHLTVFPNVVNNLWAAFIKKNFSMAFITSPLFSETFKESHSQNWFYWEQQERLICGSFPLTVALTAEITAQKKGFLSRLSCFL